MQWTLTREGRFYKGNLHMHTTLSDGHYSPAQLAAYYRQHGYDFVALTEHRIFTHFEELKQPGFLIIPAVEADATSGKDYRQFHFIALPGPEASRLAAVKSPYTHGQPVPQAADTSFDTLQAYIDDFIARGYMLMINHPHWSTLEYDDILPLKNLFAIEVYNNGCAMENNMDRSGVIWDALLRRGARLWGTAVDDAHSNFPFDSHKNDSCGGFVMVKARELTIEAICEALYGGSFYASSGPVIHDFYIDGDIGIVKCAPANAIHIVCDLRQAGYDRLPEGKEGLTEFRYKLSGTERYVRAEVVAADGKRAYTNPIFLR